MRLQDASTHQSYRQKSPHLQSSDLVCIHPAPSAFISMTRVSSLTHDFFGRRIAVAVSSTGFGGPPAGSAMVSCVCVRSLEVQGRFRFLRNESSSYKRWRAGCPQEDLVFTQPRRVRTSKSARALVGVLLLRLSGAFGAYSLLTNHSNSERALQLQ